MTGHVGLGPTGLQIPRPSLLQALALMPAVVVVVVVAWPVRRTADRELADRVVRGCNAMPVRNEIYYKSNLSLHRLIL